MNCCETAIFLQVHQSPPFQTCRPTWTCWTQTSALTRPTGTRSKLTVYPTLRLLQLIHLHLPLKLRQISLQLRATRRLRPLRSLSRPSSWRWKATCGTWTAKAAKRRYERCWQKPASSLSIKFLDIKNRHVQEIIFSFFFFFNHQHVFYRETGKSRVFVINWQLAAPSPSGFNEKAHCYSSSVTVCLLWWANNDVIVSAWLTRPQKMLVSEPGLWSDTLWSPMWWVWF